MNGTDDIGRRRWMVVRRDAKIPGGWRVIAANYNEEMARRIAAAYDDDYQAMPTSRLYDLRMKAMGLV